MTDLHLYLLSPFVPVGRFLSALTPDWVRLAIDIADRIRWPFSTHKDQGMYEILEYDSTLELSDAKGKMAVHKRHQRVKFLQNHIVAFQDFAWGDGEIFADYKVSPGIVADRYQDGDRWNVLISLRETKSRGDVQDFHFERTIKDGFTQDEEWWQVEVWQKTDLLRLRIYFPRNRNCKRAILHTRTDNKTTVLDSGHFQALPDGRQLLRWQTKNPKQAEIYTVRWTW